MLRWFFLWSVFTSVVEQVTVLICEKNVSFSIVNWNDLDKYCLTYEHTRIQIVSGESQTYVRRTLRWHCALVRAFASSSRNVRKCGQRPRRRSGKASAELCFSRFLHKFQSVGGPSCYNFRRIHGCFWRTIEMR